MSISPARAIAFDVLRRVATQDAYADESLRAALDQSVGPADAGLATEITLGVLRWQQLLDFLVDRYLTKKSKSLDIEVRIALRMGMYQLYFLGRVPEHASVNESVELVKKARKRSAAPLVNAVLRKAAKEPNRLEAQIRGFASLLPAQLPTADLLGIQHSHPAWVVERWLRTYGEERTRALMQTNNRAPSLSAFLVDPQHRDAAIASLKHAGCEVNPGLLLSGAWTLRGGNPSTSQAAQSGWIAIQDEASQIVAHLVSIEPGNQVLDLCAAPGGKTLMLSLAAGPDGHIVAADLHAHRARAMKERFERAGARNIECHVLDATKQLPFNRQFDRILVDAPCSGTGTLARHPEIRWRLRPEDLSDLHARQVKLLSNALPALKPGGRLVYSTCSLEPEENELVINEALAGSNQFRLAAEQKTLKRILRDKIALESLVGADGFFRTFPPEHGTDGFFAAVIERTSNR